MTCNCRECREEIERARREKKLNQHTHAVSFVSNCDVQLLCTGDWTLPCSSTIDPDVLVSEDGYKYTQDKTKVECSVCQEKMKPVP